MLQKRSPASRLKQHLKPKVRDIGPAALHPNCDPKAAKKMDCDADLLASRVQSDI